MASLRRRLLREGKGMVRTEVPGAKIEGGFVLVPVPSLIAAWKACQSRPLGIGDFRAWLAIHEMVARRGHLDDDRAPAYGVAELARLLGVAERRARASIRRLVAAGLLQWSPGAIVFPEPLNPDLQQTADSIGGGRGVVAVPRRMLRHLAHVAAPALIATTLGMLLRCLSRRRAGFDGRGRVKAAWIAAVFAVDRRRVLAARKDLVALRWIAARPSDQRAENRWGRAYKIDLAWDRPKPGGRSLTPLPRPALSLIDTPSVDQDPLPEREIHQEPAGRGLAGVQSKGEGDKPLPAPTLEDVRPEDLVDTARTLKLHAQAVARGLVGPSEADRLKFLALAEHSRSYATRNAGGLFATLIRRGAGAFATQPEEDRARRRLREHDHGPGRTAPEPKRRSSFVPEELVGVPTALGDLMMRLGLPGGSSSRGREGDCGSGLLSPIDRS